MLIWFANTLLVLGPPEDIRRFRHAVLPHTAQRRSAGTALSLRSLSPGADTYHAHLERWGTPWDVRTRLVTETTEGVDYTFRFQVDLPIGRSTLLGHVITEASSEGWSPTRN